MGVDPRSPSWIQPLSSLALCDADQVRRRPLLATGGLAALIPRRKHSGVAPATPRKKRTANTFQTLGTTSREYRDHRTPVGGGIQSDANEHTLYWCCGRAERWESEAEHQKPTLAFNDQTQRPRGTSPVRTLNAPCGTVLPNLGSVGESCDSTTRSSVTSFGRRTCGPTVIDLFISLMLIHIVYHSLCPPQANCVLGSFLLFCSPCAC